MGKVIMSGIVPQLEYEAPVKGIALSTLAEGSIVKLNENGSPVEFYVAKHNYERSLNGAGRTLLVRKDCYDQRKWHSTLKNAYSDSSIDTWLNNNYKALLDDVVKTAIGTTKFYYTPGNGSTSVTTLSRSVFLLSVKELGLSFSMANTEGSELPIASSLRIAYLDGSAVQQWTRTPRTNTSSDVCFVYNTGSLGTCDVTSTVGARPCFTLQSTALFDEETLLFKEVS